MPRIVVDIDSEIPAERMLAAATDFSERRPELWPDISREFWRLHDRGPNWAEATEGSPAVWARERYEWSGNRVVGTTQASNVFQPGGTWTLTAQPSDGASSHIRIVLDRRFKGKGWLFYPAVALFGRSLLKHNLQKTLNVLARTSRNAPRACSLDPDVLRRTRSRGPWLSLRCASRQRDYLNTYALVERPDMPRGERGRAEFA